MKQEFRNYKKLLAFAKQRKYGCQCAVYHSYPCVAESRSHWKRPARQESILEGRVLNVALYKPSSSGANHKQTMNASKRTRQTLLGSRITPGMSPRPKRLS